MDMLVYWARHGKAWHLSGGGQSMMADAEVLPERGWKFVLHGFWEMGNYS